MNPLRSALKQIPILFIPLLGALFLALITKQSRLGVAPDSISYMSVAQHIAAGKGVQVFMANISPKSFPLTAWPPMFPLIISVFSLMHVTLQTSTWIINTALFGLNLYLVSYLVCKYTNKTSWAMLTALIFLLEPRWHFYHAWIVSEPLYIFFTNLSILFLWKYTEDSLESSLVFSILFTGLSALTRFVGLANCLAGAFIILIFYKKSRYKSALIFAFFSSLPLVLWSLRNYVLTKKPNNTVFEAMFGSQVKTDPLWNSFWQNLDYSYQVFRAWTADFFNGKENLFFIFLAFFLLIGIIAGLLSSAKKTLKDPDGRLPVILFSYTVIDTLFLNFILWLSHYHGQMIDRYLLISLTHLVLFLILAVYMTWQQWIFPRKMARVLVCVFCAFLIAAWTRENILKIIEWSQTISKSGVDLSEGARWDFVNRIKWLP